MTRLRIHLGIICPEGAKLPTRTNMIVYYDDPEWVVKTDLYNRFGCHKGGY